VGCTWYVSYAMFRGAAAVPIMLVVIYTAQIGCGGATTGAAGGVDADGGDGGVVAAEGSSAVSVLVACNDGTGDADCCPESATSGASCNSDTPCWTRCSSGLGGEMSCSGGIWSAGHGLFPCGPPARDAGLSGPAACVAAGGQCVVGGFTGCSKLGTQDCNPDRNPGGAFCCLDRSVSQTCDASVQTIRASDYDQTCQTDSDCLGVSEGNACYPCTLGCPSTAINVAAKAQYSADVAKILAGLGGGEVRCNCPASFNPCCLGGKCHADAQCTNL